MPNSSLIEKVDYIIALDENPVLRNLLITQCYADLAHGMAGVLGQDNANWCNFATWASKTAGRFIRQDEIPDVFRDILGNSKSLRARLSVRVDDLGNVIKRRKSQQDKVIGVLGLVDRIALDVSAQIAGGNLRVFSELAPVFAQFIDAYEGVEEPKRKALKAIQKKLKDGPSSQGGQTLLKEALSSYYNALVEKEPKEKAELMLLANGLTGLHEQIRLQEFIAGSLNAPIDDAVGASIVDMAAILPDRIEPGVFRAMRFFARPVIGEIRSLWLDFSTDELMTLSIGNDRLRLGKDLKPPPAGPLFPPQLLDITNVNLGMALDQYQALTDGSDDSGAEDWTRLGDRMRFIYELFRSRQQVSALFEPPFAPIQHRAILDGVVPEGPL